MPFLYTRSTCSIKGTIPPIVAMEIPIKTSEYMPEPLSIPKSVTTNTSTPNKIIMKKITLPVSASLPLAAFFTALQFALYCRDV